MITLMGDIHGCWQYIDNARKRTKNTIIVAGDFGIGFERSDDGIVMPDPYFNNVKFVRGNHDNPYICEQRNDYLGDYGVSGDVGFISGAWSIDRAYRTESIDWWMNEELSYDQLNKAIDLIVAKKPPIIISHCAPQIFAKELVRELYGNRTEQAMQSLFDQYQPEQWICGHYHCPMNLKIGRTMFTCLDIAETMEIDATL
jgi:hypothetical protein